jgi:hypothetical protein
MRYRRSPDSAEASRNWERFLNANAALIAESGLPGWVTKSSDRFTDFLMHGYLDHHPDPARFNVDQLSDAEYGGLVRLTEAYFAAGYGYLSPMALRRGGTEKLEALFAHPDR